MKHSHSHKLIITHPMDSRCPVQGGGIRYLMNVLRFFVQAGWEATVLGTQGEPANESYPWKHVALCAHSKGSFRYLIELYCKLPFIRTQHDAIVITHRMDCMLPFVLFKHSQRKILISAAPMYYLRLRFPRLFPVLRRVYQVAERICLASIDVLVPVDQATEKYYLDQYPGIQSKIVKIPSSIELHQFALSDQTVARRSLSLPPQVPLVVFVGRLAPVKNVPLLLRAFERLKQRMPNCQLLIIGDGESAAEIKALTTQSDGIMLIGAVPPNEIQFYLNAADVLALCSIEEGSPTVVKEALACGLPVVATDVGDVRTVLSANQYLGTVVSPNEQELADALAGWLFEDNGKPEARIIRRCAAEKFDTSNTLARLVQIGGSLCSR
jgi:L-malate glycosyltransferase